MVIELPASNLLGVTLDDTGDRGALVADDNTSLVDLLTLQEGQVSGLLLRGLVLLVAVGVANNGALLVDDVSIFVNSAAEELLSIALGDDTDNVAVLVSDVAILDDLEAFKTGEGSFFVGVLLGNSLGTADDLALVVPELTLGIGGEARLRELLSVTLNKLTNNVSIAVEKLASLVDGQAIKDG